MKHGNRATSPSWGPRSRPARFRSGCEALFPRRSTAGSSPLECGTHTPPTATEGKPLPARCGGAPAGRGGGDGGHHPPNGRARTTVTLHPAVIILHTSSFQKRSLSGAGKVGKTRDAVVLQACLVWYQHRVSLSLRIQQRKPGQAPCLRVRGAGPQSPRDFCASCLATRQNCSRSSRHILEASTLAPLSSLGSASMLTTDSRIFSTLCTGLHRSALLS